MLRRRRGIPLKPAGGTLLCLSRVLPDSGLFTLLSLFISQLVPGHGRSLQYPAQSRRSFSHLSSRPCLVGG